MLTTSPHEAPALKNSCRPRTVPRFGVLPLLGVLLAAACTGETPVTQTPGVFSGTVLDAASGLPIAGAEIALYDDVSTTPGGLLPAPLRFLEPGADLRATSDAAGRFAIPAEPGVYGVGASADGYVNYELGAAAPGLPGIPWTMGDRVDEPVEIRLTPEGRVTGSVVDVDGRAVEAIGVYLLNSVFDVDGTRRLVVETETRTDDTGQYRITRIPAGRYLVATGGDTGDSDLPFGLPRNFELPHDSDDTEYGWSFWPGDGEPVPASSIAIAAGSTTELDALVVEPPRPRRVRGRIVDTAFDAPPPHAVVTVHSAPRFGLSAVDYVTADYDAESGVFEVELVEGTYRVGVSLGEDPIGPERRERRLRPRDAWMPLEVGTADIDDMLIRAPASGSLQGQILLSNRETFGSIAGSSGGPGVVLQPLEPLQQSAAIRPITIDGSFEVPNLVSGRYRVVPRMLPDDYYVSSVSLNGAASDSMLIDIPADTDNSLIVRLAPDGGRIDLNVVDSEGLDVPGATVLLVPDPVPERIGFHKWTLTDRLGRSVLSQAPPGNYRLLAWLDVARAGFPPPEAYRDAGVAVEVLQNAAVKLQVETEEFETLVP